MQNVVNDLCSCFVLLVWLYQKNEVDKTYVMNRKIIYAYKFLLGDLLERQLARPRCIWVGSIKMDLNPFRTVVILVWPMMVHFDSVATCVSRFCHHRMMVVHTWKLFKNYTFNYSLEKIRTPFWSTYFAYKITALICIYQEDPSISWQLN